MGALTTNYMQRRHQKSSKEELFEEQKYRRMEKHKPRGLVYQKLKSEIVKIGKRVE